MSNPAPFSLSLHLQAFGAGGMVDFFLPEPLSMALELTRDGSRLSEHIARFLDAGKYGPLLQCGAVTQHAVVDLRSPPASRTAASPRRQDAHLYTVLFRDDFHSAELWHEGEMIGGQPLHVCGMAGAQTVSSLESLLTMLAS